MQSTTYHGYHITGNKYLAIAINVNDPKDAHYFDIDPDCNNDAYVRAMGWAYPGAGTEEEAEHRQNLHNALKYFMSCIPNAENGFIIRISGDEELNGRIVFTKEGMLELPDAMLGIGNA